MQMRKIVLVGLASATTVGAVFGAGFLQHKKTAKSIDPSQVTLWAWERRENLAFLKSGSHPVKIGYLAKTIHIANGSVFGRPRLQPLIIDKRSQVVPVIRIECNDAGKALQDEGNCAAILSRVINQIRPVAERPDVRMIQIDFDARASERPFYRSLLQELRSQIAAEIRISITALASWCLGDYWLDGLPVDEVVPMFFTMGAGVRQVETALERGDRLKCPHGAKLALGISTDQSSKAIACARGQLSRQYGNYSTYIFNPRPWTYNSVRNAVLEEEQWQDKEDLRP